MNKKPNEFQIYIVQNEETGLWVSLFSVGKRHAETGSQSFTPHWDTDCISAEQLKEQIGKWIDWTQMNE